MWTKAICLSVRWECCTGRKFAEENEQILMSLHQKTQGNIILTVDTLEVNFLWTPLYELLRNL